MAKSDLISPENAPRSSLRGWVRLVLLTVLTLVILPLQFLMFVLTFGSRKTIWILPNVWFKIACPLIGVRIHVQGENIRATQKKAGILYVANHAAILDIPVLGNVLKAVFIAKSDIAGWPIFGFLAKMQATIFVERRRAAAQKQKYFLKNLLATGHHLTLFPEGTTSNGFEIYPFKSSLFAALLEASQDKKSRPIYIQPVTIRYTHLDGVPIKNAQQMDQIAWYGDMVLAPHLWNNFKGRSIDVTVQFDAPILVEPAQDRKALSAELEQTVRANFDRIAQN